MLPPVCFEYEVNRCLTIACSFCPNSDTNKQYIFVGMCPRWTTIPAGSCMFSVQSILSYTFIFLFPFFLWNISAHKQRGLLGQLPSCVVWSVMYGEKPQLQYSEVASNKLRSVTKAWNILALGQMYLNLPWCKWSTSTFHKFTLVWTCVVCRHCLKYCKEVQDSPTEETFYDLSLNSHTRTHEEAAYL